MKPDSARETAPYFTARHKRARQALRRLGWTVTAWAVAHGFPRGLVFAVLSGRKPCHTGQMHRIAVLLGIKPGGEITDGPQAVTAHLRAAARANPAPKETR